MRDDAQRNQVIDTALEKFRKYGIRRVTLDEIARELRISKKTLYTHFSDKEALVTACIERNVSQIMPKVNAALSSKGTASEKVVRMWQAASNLPRLVTPELIADLKADYPHLWEAIDSRRKAALARFEGIIDAGRKTGEIRPEIHPKVMLRMIMAFLDRIITPDVLVQGEFSPAEALNTIFTVIGRGMFVHPPALPPMEPLP